MRYKHQQLVNQLAEPDRFTPPSHWSTLMHQRHSRKCAKPKAQSWVFTLKLLIINLLMWFSQRVTYRRSALQKREALNHCHIHTLILVLSASIFHVIKESKYSSSFVQRLYFLSHSFASLPPAPLYKLISVCLND